MRYTGLKILLLLCTSSILLAQPDYYSGTNGKKLDWVLFYLTENYVDTTDNDLITDIAIKRMVQELDPYCKYQTKQEIKEMEEANKGYSPGSFGFNYFAIGDTTLVTYLAKGGPAELAGLKLSDRIININGQDVTGYNFKLVKEITEDTSVHMLDLDLVSAFGQRKQLQIKKDRVPLLSIKVAYPISPKIGYMQLGTFTTKTRQEFLDALQSFKDQSINKLIIDLRSNYGGAVIGAEQMTSEFLPKDNLMFYSEGLNMDRKDFMSDENQAAEGFQVILLQDENTMSAAEMFIGALQDYDRALIMGVQSFGKGLIQQSYRLPDESALRLTIGKYYLPSGRFLQNQSEVGLDLSSYTQGLSNPYSMDLAMPDSLYKKTMTGRRIIDGNGGIVPDIYFNETREAQSTYHQSLNKRGLLFSFVCSYVMSEKVTITRAYANAKEFLRDSPFQAQLRVLLNGYLRSEIKKRNLSESIPPDEVTDAMMNQVNGWIVGQIWDNESYFMQTHKTDPLIQKAMASFYNDAFTKVGISKK